MPPQEVQTNGVRRVILPGRRELEPRRIRESVRNERRSARSIRRMKRGDAPVSTVVAPPDADEKMSFTATVEMHAPPAPSADEVERDRQKLFPEVFGEKKGDSK